VQERSDPGEFLPPHRRALPGGDVLVRVRGERDARAGGGDIESQGQASGSGQGQLLVAFAPVLDERDVRIRNGGDAHVAPAVTIQTATAPAAVMAVCTCWAWSASPVTAMTQPPRPAPVSLAPAAPALSAAVTRRSIAGCPTPSSVRISCAMLSLLPKSESLPCSRLPAASRVSSPRRASRAEP